ncbi:putative oxidoreductase [Microdochium bolleyi]|uniref:Putative oxidoreductase n=1 Tax=Microdochium bolleyi TaxID=196109 RepID=A0A136IVA7_9PEZI|nr:putative oxidoreductase [Microdochium bolleyi]
MSAAIRESNLWPTVGFIKNTHTDTYPDIDPLKADLSGKTVVITGASRGVGRAAAIAFAQAGASNIALTARSDLSELVAAVKAAARDAGRAAEPTVISASLDVASDPDVARFAQQVGDAFGAVDLLVNNAGYLSPWDKPFAETDTAEWWKNWEVNIKGVYLFSRYFVPLVLKSSSLKTILNVSSMGAVAISEGGSGYQTTKFAVCRLTEHIAAEYADQGLIVVAAHPGAIKTDMGNRLPESHLQWLTDTVELPAHWMTWFARERREWMQARFVNAQWDVKDLEARKEEIVEENKLKFRLVI